jgi:hypothetical protein
MELDQQWLMLMEMKMMLKTCTVSSFLFLFNFVLFNFILFLILFYFVSHFTLIRICRSPAPNQDFVIGDMVVPLAREVVEDGQGRP